MSPVPASAVMSAIEHVNSPIIVYRDDTHLFGIMLANALSQFGVDIDPEGAWLALADANVEYCGVKEHAMKAYPDKVIEDAVVRRFVETPIEEVYREQYLRELAGRGWLPRWLGERFGQEEEPK